MRTAIHLIFTPVLFLFLYTTSCSSHILTSGDLVGIYICKVSISPQSIEKDSTFEYNTKRYSNEVNNVYTYIKGDTGNYACTHFIYQRFTPYYLQLNNDGSFSCSNITNCLIAKGTWRYIAGDYSLILDFEQLPKDTLSVVSRLISSVPLPYEGNRQLKVLNNNKLQFESHIFKAPSNYKEISTFKRQN